MIYIFRKLWFFILFSFSSWLLHADTLVVDKRHLVNILLDNAFLLKAYKVYLKKNDQSKHALSGDPDFKFDQKIQELKIIDKDKREVFPLENRGPFSDAPARVRRLLAYLEQGQKDCRKDFSGEIKCNQFSYYLATGKMNTLLKWDTLTSLDLEDPEINRLPYAIKQYFLVGNILQLYCNTKKAPTVRVHNFMSLGDDVMVSKFGELGVSFTPFSEILRAYVPKKEELQNCELRLGTILE